MCRSVGASLFVERAMHHQLFIEGTLMVFQALPVASQPIGINISNYVASEMHDSPTTLIQQVVRDIVSCVIIVDYHARAVLVLMYPVEENYRDLLLKKHVEVLDIFGVISKGNQ